MHQIGPYRIEAILAQGRRGYVYKGVHDGLKREVVIKAVSLGPGTDPEERKRILTQARAQIRLQHPNIVATCDLIEDQGQAFIAMEHVEGTTLDVLLARRKGEGFSLDEALRLFEQVLAALDYAHGQGVVHRNIKPANLMVCDGQVKVMDFATALFRQPVADNVAYLSPEQLLSAETDPRTDLYCIALVLYEMLVGRHPFQGAAGLDLVQCHLAQAPPDLKALVPELPTGVSETVAIALEKDPRRRFQTVEDLLRALREGAAGFLPVVPEPAANLPPVESAPMDDGPFLPPPGISPPALAQDRRSRLVAASCVLVGLGLAGSWGLWRAWYRPPETVRIEPPVVLTSAPAPTPTPEPGQAEPVPTPSPDPPAIVSPVPEPVVEPAPEPAATPPPPTPREPDPKEVRRLEVGRLQEEFRLGILSAEAEIRAEGFDAAEEIVDRLAAQARLYSAELSGEIARLQELRSVLDKIEDKRREWEIRVQQIEKLLEQGKYPEADSLARDLGNEPGVPEAVADRARELSMQAKEELKRIWGTTQTGPTRNKLRKPPGS